MPSAPGRSWARSRSSERLGRERGGGKGLKWMWDCPTSMRPVLRNAVVVALAAVAIGAGFAGGWYAHPASSANRPIRTLGVIAAGSLSPTPLLPSLVSAFVNQTPGIASPRTAQLYQGSNADATAIVSAGSASPYDVFVSADYRVIPEALMTNAPPYATGEAVFASDPVVLAYNPSALSGVTSSNWYEKIVGNGIVLGVANASSDPLGVNAIVTIELQDRLAGLNGSLYHHFFTGPMGGFAGPTANTRYVVENDASVALSIGEVQAYLIYESYARADGLTYTTLNESVNLGGTTASDVAAYGSARTTVLSGTSTEVVAGAPAIFALTVPSNAPDPALGDSFASWLVSNSTLRVWASEGFVPTPSVWVYGSAGYLAPGLPTLPSYLTALIAA